METCATLSIGVTGMPRGTRVRLTSTPSGRCAGMDVLPFSGGASDKPEGTTVRSSM